MNSQKLEELGIDLGGAQSGIKKTFCPVCYNRKGHKRDKDLSVNIDNGMYKCHSPNCNFRGKVSDKEYKRPEYKKRLAGIPRELSIYLNGRGISDEVIKSEDIGYENGSVVFNYFKSETLVNYKKRGIVDKKFSQFAEAEKVLYRYDSLRGKTKGIFVEGEMDALTWVELGFDKEYAIVSLDNGANKEGRLDGKLECLTNAALGVDKISEWYLAGDNDEAGIYTFKEIGRRIGEFRCKKVELGKHKDSNDKLQDLLAAKMPREQIVETFSNLLKDASPLPVLGVTVLDQPLIEEMLDEYNNGVDKGEGIGISLDDNWTALNGEMSLITGYPGDGKSQFLRYVCVLHAIRNDMKFACYCVEDNPAKYFYSDLAKTYMGKNIDKKYPERASEFEYRDALNFIKSRFFYIHPEPDPITGIYPLPDNRWINEKISFLKLQHGVDAYIKDPWNKIYHNITQREDQYLANELSQEKLFAASFRLSLYVAHPVGNPQREKDGSLKSPSQFTISGGAMFNNMMDNIIVVFRPDREGDPKSKRVQVIVKKIKKQGIRGGEGTLEYNFHRNTNRYEEAFDEAGFEILDSATPFVRKSDPAFDQALFEELPF